MGRKIARRRCKCASCGADGWNDEFFRVTKGSRNIYYCNKEEYEAIKKEEECRDNTLIYIAKEIWPVPDYRMLPTVLQKELNKLAKIYTHEVVFKAVEMEKDSLKYWMNVDNKFTSEFGKAKYFISILSNGATNRAYKQLQQEKIREKQEQARQAEIERDNGNLPTLEDMIDVKKKQTEHKKHISDGLADLLKGVDI